MYWMPSGFIMSRPPHAWTRPSATSTGIIIRESAIWVAVSRLVERSRDTEDRAVASASVMGNLVLMEGS
jgi:hypothetical protein